MMSETSNVEAVKRKRQRSPNYPSVDLEKAIQRVAELSAKYGRHEAPVGTVRSLWGYADGSTVGNQCVAALKAYGLIEVFGKGEQRKITLSEEGERIVRGAPNRDELIRQAALNPPILREIWEHYGDKGLPHDELLRQYLVWDRPENSRFNEDMVDAFIGRFRASLQFAKLFDSDIMEDENGDDEKTLVPPVRVGDCVQWTVQGVDQFKVPQRVVAADGDYAFVESSPTGLPMDQLTVTDPPLAGAGEAASVANPPENPYYKPPHEEDEKPCEGTTKERTTLDEGPVLLSMPEKLGPGSVRDFHRWIEDQKERAYRRAGGQHKTVPLPDGGSLHLVSHPGSDKWNISSYDFSWLSGMTLMTATVHAAANGWELIEFDTPDETVAFVMEKPIPSIVPRKTD